MVNRKHYNPKQELNNNLVEMTPYPMDKGNKSRAGEPRQEEGIANKLCSGIFFFGHTLGAAIEKQRREKLFGKCQK
jgi:hypothetical protein